MWKKAVLKPGYSISRRITAVASEGMRPFSGMFRLSSATCSSATGRSLGEPHLTPLVFGHQTAVEFAVFLEHGDKQRSKNNLNISPNLLGPEIKLCHFIPSFALGNITCK